MIVLVAITCCIKPAKAQVSISPKVINLGEISTSNPISFEFLLTNNSDSPVCIISVGVNTAAIKKDFPKKPIPVNGTGVIKMTLFTQDLRPGLLNKTIRVRTSGKPRSHQLAIKGDVLAEIPLNQTRNDGGISWIRTYSNGKYGAMINSKNIISPNYDNLSYCSLLDCFIGISNNNLSLLDLNGKILCITDFQEYIPDRYGILIKNNSSWGYIDKLGNTIIPTTTGYKKLVHQCFDEIGEYFLFSKDDTIGILDRRGDVTFELPKTNQKLFIIPYYIGNLLLYVSDDGIYDKNRNKIFSFNKIFIFQPTINEYGDILVPYPTENGLFETTKIGSIYNLSCVPSENPYKH